MIADQFPQLRELSDGDKLDLADELTGMVLARCAAAVQEEVSECLAAYQNDRDAVVTWETVRRSLRPHTNS